MEDCAISLLSKAEVDAIREIEATTDILKLILKLTRMRFAAIAKFSDSDWVACSVVDEAHLGIEAKDSFPLEHSMCSNLLIDQKNLIVSCISGSEQYRNNISAQRYGFDCCISVPIFLPGGRLFGAICVLDPHARELDDSDTIETLAIFSKLIGNIIGWHERDA